MATLNKDFKIKSGLIVEGSTATVNGNDILTETASDQYILDLVGGETLVKSVSGNLSVDNAGDLTIDQEGLFDTLVSDGLATETFVSDAIENIDLTFNTDEISEGATNKFYADSLVDSHLSAGPGIAYNAGTIGADVSTGLEFKNGNGAIQIDRTTVDTWYDDNGAAAAAQTAAQSYADSLASNYDAAGAAAAAQTAAEGFATQAIADLVDSAPSTLDTLNELAQALQDNPDIISDLQDIAAGKQDTLTAGSNIDITGATISVTGLDTDDVSEGTNLYFTNQRALDATSAAYDAAGAAAGLINDASNTTTEVWSAYKTSTEIGLAQQAAIDHADGLDTDDVAEGTSNLYFSDVRAKTSAAALITGATKTNITITGDENGLTITAENGVADSDTDALEEGETNLYFTDERAVDAIGGSNIQPLSIDINTYRKEEATQQYVANASTVTAHTFTGNKSVKYLVRTVGNVSGTLHSQVTELLVTVDGAGNVAVTEYGTIYTSENPLSTATMDYASGTYSLRVTTAITGAEVVAAATIMSWAD